MRPHDNPTTERLISKSAEQECGDSGRAFNPDVVARPCAHLRAKDRVIQ